MTDRGRLVALIAATTGARLVLAMNIGPGNDEAYHALFAVHPDWSYFDHPPMMAWVARAGMLLSGGALSAPAMRTGFILLAAGSTWMMSRLTSRFFGERAGLIAAFTLDLTAYYGIAAGTFILPDGPLLFFWLLTLDRLAAAFSEPDRLGLWVAAGLAWGGGMLSKYHAVFLPMGAALFLVIDPASRRCLRKPGPYLAALIGSAMFAPVVIWNAQHGWASFAFQGARAGGSSFRPLGVLIAVGGQALYLLPWIWAALWKGIVRSSRRSRDADGWADRFLLSQAILPTVAFLAVASRRDVLPHWSLVGMIPAFPLLGRDWASVPGRALRRRFALMAVVPLLGVAAFVAQSRTGFAPIGPLLDPTVDLVGWDEVAKELDRRGLLDRPGTFFFTSKWFLSGHLAFATGNRVPVACYNWRAGHNFDYWEKSADWVGHDGYLMVVNDSANEPDVFRRFFESIEKIDDFSLTRGGRTIRRIRLFRCVRQLVPIPTGYETPASSPGDGPPR